MAFFFDVICEMKNFKWLLCLLGLLSFTTGRAQSYKILLIDDQKEWTLADHIYYLPSPDLLTPEQVFSQIESKQAPLVKGDRFRQGFSQDYFWLYLKVKNVDSRPLKSRI